MSSDVKCVLCCQMCREGYKNLYNSNGESNNIYDLVVKYFDPMLLFPATDIRSWICVKVLCDTCWNHINDFQEFQQTVLKAQTELAKKEQDDINCVNEVTYNGEFIIKPALPDDSTKIKKKLNTPILIELLNKKSKYPQIEAECETKRTIVESLHTKHHDGSEKSDTSNNIEDSDSFPEQSIIVTQYLDTVLTSGTNNNENSNDETDDDANDDNNNEEPLMHLIKKKSSIMNKTSNKNGSAPFKLSHNRKRLKTSTIQSDEGKVTKNLRSAKNAKANKCNPIKVAHNSSEKMREFDAFIAQYRPELECDICNVKVANFVTLRTHFNQRHQTQCYVKCCDRSFFRRCKFVDHLRLHVNPNLYKCDVCGRASSTKYNLILHKQSMHNSDKNRYECEICHRMFNQKPSLERHMATHATGNKDFVCKECGKAYVLEVQLQTHVKTVHSVNLICDQCGKTLHGVGNLRQHLREHAGIKQPKWSCNECGTELMTRSNLNHHKLSFHHDGSVVYVCKECGKVTASERALLLHKKNVHEAVRKFKCMYCDKAFKKNKILQEHIATHTGQDLYNCPHCTQTFKVSANMHHHRKRAHPIEWAQARQNRLQLPKINLNMVKKEIVL